MFYQVKNKKMKTSELIREIERLPIRKRIYVIQRTIHTIAQQEDASLMSNAVSALLEDYKTDKELTAFTKLDFDSFYEARWNLVENLDPTIGAEITKTRPAIIVNDNALGKLPLKVIVPITDWKDRYEIASWMVKIEPDNMNGLTKVWSADCFQVRSVSEERFVWEIGEALDIMDDMKIGLSKVLSINFE